MRGNAKEFRQFDRKFARHFYLVNFLAIQLRDRWFGGYIFANSWEPHFIPRGFAPWDEIGPLGFAISIHPSKWSCNNIINSVSICSRVFWVLWVLLSIQSASLGYLEMFNFNINHALKSQMREFQLMSPKNVI